MEGIKDKVVFAIEQPDDVDVGEIIVGPTAQS
jgi:NADP-dependent 3-hydroxy acid dehydrogenase YdfG